MQINTPHKRLPSNSLISDFLNYLQKNENELRLQDSEIYIEFPIYKDIDGDVVISKILLVSPWHGVIVISTSDITLSRCNTGDLEIIDEALDRVFTAIYSRLIRNKNLKRDKRELKFCTDSILFAPFVGDKLQISTRATLISSYASINDYFKSISESKLNIDDYNEIIATIEGSKGLVRQKSRDISSLSQQSKGYIAGKVESELAIFDQHQKHGYMLVLDGLQRIRGLAGSGKTVILSMKAALTHLREPDATIVYTFSTKSLYQQVKLLITRFYRQFDDRDPDWNKVKIRHAWGGKDIEGVYYFACINHGVQPIQFKEAVMQSRKPPFDYVCQQLIDNTVIKPVYDYCFIDEGQDFPASFLKLCVMITKNQKVVWAYDDLQTIFQASTPSTSEIFGVDNEGNSVYELSEDIVLYKCYRNPREIIVCAHAIGFGFYGSRIVQMLENKDHWEDIGYKYVAGEFTEGNVVKLERPKENSLTTISEAYTKNDIIQVDAFKDFNDEVDSVSASIMKDIKEGLRPDDILVIVVDDRNAKIYLSELEKKLAKLSLQVNNIHADSFGIREFQRENQITLSTVHKAKGNESFMVYILGVDALFTSYAGVRERNILFTAMTRAKGWVRLSGVGDPARVCKSEIDKALENFPYLKFTYPSEYQLEIMRRDLTEHDAKKQELERMLDEVLQQMTPDEVKRFVEHRSIVKGQKNGTKK